MPRLVPAAIVLAAILTGCVSVPPSPGSQATQAPHPLAPKDFPVRIAVLPVINNSGTADGAVIIRAMVVRKVGWELGFIVTKPSDVDDVLDQRELGYSGHPARTPLERTDPSLVASWLGVDGLLHGEVDAFSKSQISLYAESNVKIKFWLTDASGKKIWEGESKGGGGGVGSGSAGLGPILSDGSLPSDVLDKIRQSPVSQAALSTVDDAFAKFPRHY